MFANTIMFALWSCSGCSSGDSVHPVPEPEPVGIQYCAVPFGWYTEMYRFLAAAAWARAVRGAKVSSHGTASAMPAPFKTCRRLQLCDFIARSSRKRFGPYNAPALCLFHYILVFRGPVSCIRG